MQRSFIKINFNSIKFHLNLRSFQYFYILLITGGHFALFSQERDNVEGPNVDFSKQGSFYGELNPPHGGIVFNMGKYDAEFVLDPFNPEENLTIYLLKGKYKVQGLKKVTGSIKIKYGDGNTEEIQPAKTGERFFCKLADVSRPLHLIMIMNIKGKEYSSAFSFNGVLNLK